MELERALSAISDEKEKEDETWKEVFRQIAKKDGSRDDMIDRAALKKVIWGLDLNKRIQLEASLDLPLEKVERLLKEVLSTSQAM